MNTRIKSRLITGLCTITAFSLFFNFNAYSAIDSLATERDYLRSELFRASGIAYASLNTAVENLALAKKYQAELTELRYQNSQLLLANYIRQRNPKAPAEKVALAIVTAARKYDVPVSTVAALVKIESDFNPMAKGQAQERGLTQIMETTAKSELGIDCYTYQIEKNIDCGVRYLKAHLTTYKTLEGAANRYNGGGDPNYKMKMIMVNEAIKRYGI